MGGNENKGQGDTGGQMSKKKQLGERAKEGNGHHTGGKWGGGGPTDRIRNKKGEEGERVKGERTFVPQQQKKKSWGEKEKGMPRKDLGKENTEEKKCRWGPRTEKRGGKKRSNKQRGEKRVANTANDGKGGEKRLEVGEPSKRLLGEKKWGAGGGGRVKRIYANDKNDPGGEGLVFVQKGERVGRMVLKKVTEREKGGWGWKGGSSAQGAYDGDVHGTTMWEEMWLCF